MPCVRFWVILSYSHTNPLGLYTRPIASLKMDDVPFWGKVCKVATKFLPRSLIKTKLYRKLEYTSMIRTNKNDRKHLCEWFEYYFVKSYSVFQSHLSWMACLSVFFFLFFSPSAFRQAKHKTLIAFCSQFLIKPSGVNARLKVSVPKNSTPLEKQGYMTRESPGMELSCEILHRWQPHCYAVDSLKFSLKAFQSYR